MIDKTKCECCGQDFDECDCREEDDPFVEFGACLDVLIDHHLECHGLRPSEAISVLQIVLTRMTMQIVERGPDHRAQ